MSGTIVEPARMRLIYRVALMFSGGVEPNATDLQTGLGVVLGLEEHRDLVRAWLDEEEDA